MKKTSRVKIQKSGAYGLRVAIPLWWIRANLATKGESVVWERKVRSLVIRMAGPKDTDNPLKAELFCRAARRAGADGEWFIHLPKKYKLVACIYEGDWMLTKASEDGAYLTFSIPTKDDLKFLGPSLYDRYCNEHRHQFSPEVWKQAEES